MSEFRIIQFTNKIILPTNNFFLLQFFGSPTLGFYYGLRGDLKIEEPYYLNKRKQFEKICAISKKFAELAQNFPSPKKFIFQNFHWIPRSIIICQFVWPADSGRILSQNARANNSRHSKNSLLSRKYCFSGKLVDKNYHFPHHPKLLIYNASSSEIVIWCIIIIWYVIYKCIIICNFVNKFIVITINGSAPIRSSWVNKFSRRVVLTRRPNPTQESS